MSIAMMPAMAVGMGADHNVTESTTDSGAETATSFALTPIGGALMMSSFVISGAETGKDSLTTNAVVRVESPGFAPQPGPFLKVH